MVRRLILATLIGIVAPAAAQSLTADARSVERTPTLLLAMIARNEADNFRANLPKWKPVVDAVVCGIDDRTNDGTHAAIVEVFPALPKWVYYYKFIGFGMARTRSDVKTNSAPIKPIMPSLT